MVKVQPTNIEYQFPETDSMVTKTNLKGIITYTNDDFIKASGYSRAELLGQPHNMVRHPDMPAEAFADMWKTLKAGRPWTGIVKNLRKNGDFYWVLANATPIYEKGNIVAYMSVRTKPTRQQIDEVAKMYKLFKEGKAKHLVIRDGLIVETSLVARVKHALSNVTMKKRVFTVIGSAATAMIIISSLSLTALDDNVVAFNDLYDNRVVPLGQLSQIQGKLQSNRILIRNMLLEPTSFNTLSPQVESNIETITKLWTEYTQTNLTPEETKIADDFLIARKTFVNEVLKPILSELEKGNLESAKHILETKGDIYTAAANNLEKLIQLQIDVSRDIKNSAYQEYIFDRNMLIGLVTFTILLTVVMGEILIHVIVKRFYEFSEIVKGDLSTPIDNTKRGEFSVVRDAFKISQLNNNFNLAYAKQMANENLRIKIALDNVGTNVIIADDQRKIIYINKSAEKMMQEAEMDIRSNLPNFNAKDLLGESIDVFHQNPEHQSKLLEHLQNTVTTSFEIGGRVMEVSANPVVNEQGKRLGSVAEWKDRTFEVAIEKEIANIIDAIADGNFSQRLNEAGKSDFILSLSKSINNLILTCSESLNEIVRVLSAISRGDLTQKIDADFAGTFGQLKDDANATVESLIFIVEQIKEATDSINTGAKEIASGNNDLSHRTEKQAASLEETAASMEELTSTVKHNAENATQANGLAVEASNIAQRGVNVVEHVVRTMDEINDSSRKIGDIISVIDDIAFQTNILALNAAVEAARAGDQGKGFAVVATEVRNLAQRAATAAGEIKHLINDSVGKVTGGTKLVTQAGETMGEIVTSIQGVTKMMSEITAASVEQSQGIEQVNSAVSQMDEVTQQNAALVEQSAAAAEALEAQARNLSVAVSHFKLSNARNSNMNAPTRKEVATSALVKIASKPVATMQVGHDEWEEF